MPAEFKIAIVPASDTGAMEMAMWSMLGARPVDVFAWESFGEEWVTDTVEQLKIADCRVHLGRPYGALPDLSLARKSADLVFTQNGTTSGAKIPELRLDPGGPRGPRLQRCDQRRIRAADRMAQMRCRDLLLAESAGRRGGTRHVDSFARARWRVWRASFPPRPLPKIFRMTKKGKLDQELFEGATINTPSLLATEDYIDALKWAEGIGGLAALQARANANAGVLADWADRTPWVDFLVSDPAIRSNTSVCLKVVDRARDLAAAGGSGEFAKNLAALLEKRGRGPRRGLVPVRAAGPAHLVRRHGRAKRPAIAHAVARLGVCGLSRLAQDRVRKDGQCPKY